MACLLVIFRQPTIVFVGIPLSVEVIVEVVFGCVGIPLSVEVIEYGVLTLCLSL